MTTSLLAYIPSPAQGVWHLGPVPIRAYALCIITGIIAALIIGDRRWVARGGEAGVIYDIALWTVPFGLIGGRLYHLMTDWRTYFAEGGAGFGAAVRIWDGGLGIWGAVALGGVGAWIGCRRHGIPLPAFGDAIAPGIILAQAIGRLGNYFNQELYGRPTDLPWGLQIFQRSDGSGVVNPHLLNGVSTGQVYEVVHPTFLYELLWNLLVFFFLLWADRRFRLGHGRLFALYVAAYCVGRFGVELMRSDTATLIAGIRVNSFTSTFVFIGAVVYMMVAPRGREDPATLGGRQAEEAEAEAEAEGAALAVPVAVAAGAGAVADEADAVETQSDEPVALAEQAVDTEDTVDEDAADAEAAVEESVDESGEEPVDSDEVEEEDESDAEAEELDADEAETAEAEAVEVAQESEGTTESDEAADEVAAETAVADGDDVADADDAEVEPAEAEAVEVGEESEGTTDSDEAAEETAVADGDDVADADDAEVEPAEAEAVEVGEESEGTTDSDEAAEETAVADGDDVADADDAEVEPAEAEAVEVAQESEETTESDEAADEAAAETDVADGDDVADAEDEATEATEAGEESEEATDSDADAEPAAEPAPKAEATEKVEPVGVPVWEPPAPRRRWWRRQG